MKFCTNCGNKLADEAMFCTNCGMKVAAPAQTSMQPAKPAVQEEPKPATEQTVKKEKVKKEKVKKERKKAGKGKVIAILCLVFLLAIAAVGGFFALRWYNSGEQKMLRALKAGEYEQVLDIVDEDSSLKHSDKLAKQLKERLETLKADFTANTVEYAAVNMELDTIEQIGIKELENTISEVRSYVEKLNASRTAFATAESFFASGSYVEAIAQYKQVIQEDSNYETAQSKANEATELYRTKMLQDAASYAAGEDYESALTLLKAALEDLPGDAQLTQQIQLYEKDLANKKVADALNEAERYANAEDYVSAIAVLNQYITANGENVDVKLALNNYENLYAAQLLANALGKAEDYAANGDFLAAMKTLRTYIDDYGTNASAVAALNGYIESYVDGVLAVAELKVDIEDYAGAITVIKTGLNNAPANDRLTVRLDTYTAVYVSQILAESDALLENNAYDGAMAVVDAALEVLPGNAALLEQVAKIEKAMPKNFVELFDPYQSENYEECLEGRYFSMSGVERTNGLIWDAYGGYAYFNLGEQYKTLSFDFGHVDGTTMYSSRLLIYADGVLILDMKFNADTLPKKVEIDITGVTQLLIKVNNSNWCQYGMADMVIK